jgi:ABC-type Zn uptake system ZnuABC Zn-binding protein ZnuA
MITENSGIIEIASEKITHQERVSMKQSDIVIDTVALDKSPLNKELQSYQGLYITIPGAPKEDIFYEVSAIQKQIETIRDALSERNPKQRGYYYDNAGNYIQLLRDTQDTLNSRIRKYRPLPFITI